MEKTRTRPDEGAIVRQFVKWYQRKFRQGLQSAFEEDRDFSSQEILKINQKILQAEEYAFRRFSDPRGPILEVIGGERG